MNDNDNDNDRHEPRNHAEDMDTEEIRAEVRDLLAECDGALVITANLAEFDEDGEAGAISGSAAKFVRDDLDDEDRRDLHESLVERAIDAGAKGSHRAHTVDADGLAGLLDAMAMAGFGSDDEDETDEEDTDGDAFGSMFA